MRIVRGLVVFAAFVALPLGWLPATASSALAAPAVSVRPAAHLVGGDTVRVSAAGITPSATVSITECDVFVGDPALDCGALFTTTASATGRVRTSVTLADPVYRGQEYGDPLPVYCRADRCRLFLSWTDASGAQHVLSSRRLRFVGSPATIAVRPSTDLQSSQPVSVSGTAYGARGRPARVVEELCVAIIQGHGCEVYDQQTTTVGADGTFATSFVVRSQLAPDLDCATDISPAYCQVSVQILRPDGEVDYSFGDPTWGDPHGTIAFAPAPHAS